MILRNPEAFARDILHRAVAHGDLYRRHVGSP